MTGLNLPAVRGTLLAFRPQNLGPAPPETGRHERILVRYYSTVLYFTNSCEKLKVPFYSTSLISTSYLPYTLCPNYYSFLPLILFL
jgi:hypothetical protein